MDLAEKLKILGSHKALSSNSMLKNTNGLRKSVLTGETGSEVRDISLEIDLPEKIIHDDVLITPSYMKFNDPSEGMILRECLIIRNTGKKPAFIRICEPNSMAFKLKTIKRGTKLSPGLALKKWVSYSFKRNTLLHALIPIEINKFLIDYHIICTFKAEFIQISPACIDFGIVDIGCSSGLKLLTISNIGGKSTRFTIDLGNNEMDITAKPHRGIVRPRSSEVLYVEMIGINEGKYYSEFWIKSVPNIRVPIRAIVITPRLVINYPNSTSDFTLVSFPSTFVGTRKYERFSLKNVSSKYSSFVVLAEIKKQLMPIQEIDSTKHPEFQMFEIKPIEGGLESFHNTDFSILFNPAKKLVSFQNRNHQSQDFMIFLRLIRVHCTEVEDILRAKTKIGANLDKPLSKMQMQNELSSSTTLFANQTTEIVRICLHGETELIQLQFIPDELNLEIVEPLQIVSDVVNITNLSAYSFITLTFVKFGIIDCKPSEIIIGPEETVNLRISIPGKKIFQTESFFKLSFNVFVESAESETENIKVKIATYFIKCHVKFPGIKVKNKTLTIRKQIGQNEFPNRLLKVEKCEPLTMESLGLIHIKANIDQKMKCMSNTSMPLTPLQLYYIKASPTIFNFGSVAQRVPSYQELTFENQNKFPVSVTLSSLCLKNIRFLLGNSMILKPNQSVTKFVEFRCDPLGKFNSYIDYVINGNHTFELALTADVVKKHLTFNTNKIIFGTNSLPQESYRPLWTYVELKNNLNARISFEWEMPESVCYVLEPKSGVVRGKKSLFVRIAYLPDLLKYHQAEAVMICEGGLQLSLNLDTILPSPKVTFLKDIINVGDIPLNLAYFVTSVLHNADYNEVLFEVIFSDLPHGCEVQPKTGTIPPRGVVLIHITLKFSVCVEFMINLSVIIQKSRKSVLKIKGRVPFPLITLSPKTIEIGRVHSGGFYIYPFSIKNNNKISVALKFPSNEYPEFHVSLENQPSDSTEIKEEMMITLQPEATQNLFLHFEPKNLATYDIYLPMIINNLLGPVIKENSVTEQSKEFFKSYETLYYLNGHIKLMDIPETLPKIYIQGTVIRQIVFFNKLKFCFDSRRNQNEDVLQIFNNSNLREVRINMQTSQLSESNLSFSIKWKEGKTCRIIDEMIKFTLLPSETISFHINFLTNEQGIFNAKIPIFNSDEGENKLFNWVCIEGKNAKSSIECSILEIYFNPVPLNVELQEGINLKLYNFDKNSKILSEIEEPKKLSGVFSSDILTIIFPHGNTVQTDKLKENMEICLVFKSIFSVSFQTNIKFHDDRNKVSLSIIVYGASDDCLLTTYAYPKILSTDSLNINQTGRHSTFSFFPSVMISESDLTDSIYWHLSSPRLKLSTHSALNSATKIGKISSASRMKHLSINNEVDFDEEVEISVIDQSKTSVISPNFTYPFFPLHSKMEYEQHLQKTITVAEKWIYFGVLKFQFYSDIIDGITAVLSGLCCSEKSNNNKKKPHAVGKSILDVLAAIVGPKIYSLLGVSKLSFENNNERINSVLKTYDNMLKFLMSQGAFLSHVHAIFLLNYSDYSSITDEADSMTREMFESRSKQCWLDIILQTYKSLVLYPIKGNALGENPKESNMYKYIDIVRLSSIIIPTEAPSRIDLKNSTKKAKDKRRCESEAILLAWLEYHYNQQCHEDWFQNNQIILNPMEEKKVVQLKTVNNFQNDLMEGLVFITVTAAYCSYVVKEFFSNIFIHPKSTEELLHNAICVTKAWEKIRLGFIITPEEIIKPNCVQMLMLTVHLFEVLPTYLPKNKINFNCPLTEDITHQINCSNPSDYSLGIVLQFFENDSELFSIGNVESPLRLNARDSKAIEIKYHARKINQVQSYLLLCGSAVGPNFARNQCFILEGNPSHIKSIHNYKIKTKMYYVVDKNISIQIPYLFKADYDIWISEEKPLKSCELNMSRWSNIRIRKIPRRLFINQETLSVQENVSKINLSITIACIAPDTRYFWLIFQSPPGDFVIQITSSSEPSINDSITVDWTKKKCTCTSDKAMNTCPMNVPLRIPSRNIQLWDCVHKMLRKTLNIREQEFWMKQLDTYIGLKIIHWLMDSHDDLTAKEFMHIFNTNVHYAISMADKMNFLVVPKTINIPNVRRFDKYIEIKIHIAESISQSYNCILTLSTHDKKEQRYYNVNFSCKSAAS